MVIDKPLRLSAKRIRGNVPFAIAAIRMTVTCDQCGEKFAIAYSPEASGVALVNRQAKWLVDHLVWDHIQESKHKGSITLPAV